MGGENPASDSHVRLFTQARSGCRVDVDQQVPEGAPRIITYRGTRQSIDFAKQLVATLCSDEGRDTELPLGLATMKELIVPSSAIGKVIGRAGEMVRDLQNRRYVRLVGILREVLYPPISAKSEIRSRCICTLFASFYFFAANLSSVLTHYNLCSARKSQQKQDSDRS